MVKLTDCEKYTKEINHMLKERKNVISVNLISNKKRLKNLADPNEKLLSPLLLHCTSFFPHDKYTTHTDFSFYFVVFIRINNIIIISEGNWNRATYVPGVQK